MLPGQGGLRNQPSEAEPIKNNLPDVLQRWHFLRSLPQHHGGDGSPGTDALHSPLLPLGEGGGAGSPAAAENEHNRPRTAQSFCVHKAVKHRALGETLAQLRALEGEIARGMDALEGTLKWVPGKLLHLVRF